MKNTAFFPRLIIVLALCLPHFVQAQVGINETNDEPDPSAMLDVQSTDKGMLMPRMTSAERDAILNPVPGLMIYNVEDSCFNYFSGETWIMDCGRVEGDISIPSQSFGGTSKDEGRSIATDSVGNSYMIGTFGGTATFGNISLPTSGNDDIFVAKFDPAGKVLWAIKAGGSNPDRGNGISLDDAGNSYVTGAFQGTATFGGTTLTSNGGEDIFVAKINPTGQVLWAIQIGGNNQDSGNGISTDAAGNSYVTGNCNGVVSFGGLSFLPRGGDDMFAFKLDPDGQFQWVQRAGGNSSDKGNAISFDAAGNSYLTGTFQGTGSFGSNLLTSNGGDDILFAKLNPSGQFLWSIRAGGNNDDSGRGISTDAAGNSYSTGYFFGSASFPGINLINSGNDNVFLIKFGPTGQMLWLKTPGGSSEDRGFAIATDAAGNSYITGTFQGTVNFGGTTLTNSGNDGVFVTKLDPAGQSLWTKGGGNSGPDLAFGISIDAVGNSYVTGSFKGSPTFGNETLPNNGGADIFLWILDGNNGGPVTLDVSLIDLQDGDTDASNELQSLSFSGTQLSLSAGNTADLSSLQDNLGDHMATQNLELSGYWLSRDGSNAGLFIDANDQVGIGTSTPSRPLTIRGINAVSELLAMEDNTGTAKWHLNLKDGGLNYAETGVGDGRLFLKEGGNVGIGTTNPNTQLEIVQDRAEIRLRDTRSGANGFWTEGTLMGRLSFWNTDSPNGSTLGNIDMVVDKAAGTHPDGRLEFRTAINGNASTQMVINSQGNVGIGTTDPQTLLDVEGTVSVSELEFPDGSSMTSAAVPVGVLTLGVADFQLKEQAHSVDVKTGFSSGIGGTYAVSGTVNLVAAVNLPHGAVITKMTVHGYDLHATNIRTGLLYSGFATANYGTVSSQTSSTSSGIYTLSQNLSHVVNNLTRIYYVNVDLVGGSWHSAGQLAICAVIIEYNMP